MNRCCVTWPGVAIMSRWSGRFPIATFLIHVTGSFAIGALAMLLAIGAYPLWRPLPIVGMLGGYTTFSSFEWETLAAALWQDCGTAFRLSKRSRV